MSNLQGPWRITFDTNPHDCNLRCVMCEVHSPHSTVIAERRKAKQAKPRMDFSLIEKMIQEAKALGLKEIIPSTMGEPLVYKHFTGIIDLCHQFDLKLNLTTNGTFPQKGAYEWAKLIVPVGSDVKISWNGASKEVQEKIMIGSNFNSMLSSLKTFIQVRDEIADSGGNYCKVTLQLTFLEDNLEEMIDVVKLGIDLGINRIKGHHLWAHFTEIENQNLLKDIASINKWNDTVSKLKDLAKNNPLKSGKAIVLENFNFVNTNNSNKLPELGDCPFLGKEAWVDTDGRFNPCCAPDVLRKTLGDFGNLTKDSLSDIWQSKAYKDLCQNYKNYKVCQRCNMRR